MGALQTEPFQFAFNGFLKVAFQGSRITSDAGLILIRELDERLGLATLISEHLSDSRQGLNTQFGLVDLGAAGAGRLTRGPCGAATWRRRDTRRERCLRNALNTGPSVVRTAARAELTASEAGRCCDEQECRALRCLWVYKGPIRGRQI